MDPRLSRLDERLKAAKPKSDAPGVDAVPLSSALGQAMRAGIDIVVGLAVGLGAGWLATRAGVGVWAIVLGGMLGAAAGIWNAIRGFLGLGSGLGFKGMGDRPPQTKPEAAENREAEERMAVDEKAVEEKEGPS